MERSYPVTLNDKPVGQVTVEPQGLYYCIFCKCKLNRKDMYSLVVGDVDLGILIPDGAYFYLKTRIPQKRLERKTLAFFLRSKRTEEKIRQVPVLEGEPFVLLDQLHDAWFSTTERGAVICLPVKSSRPEEEHCFHP